MSPSENHQIAEGLQAIADKLTPPTYTLTGAADWPILVIMCGLVATMIGCLALQVGFMWRDLRGRIKEDVDHLWEETRALRKEFRESDTSIKDDMKECKEKCCE